MAEITESTTTTGKHKRNRAKKVSVRVDLTPMVDLAFLLITFFMLTTTLLEQRGMDVSTPDHHGHVDTYVSECQLVYLLADSGSRYYYWEGIDCKAVTPIDLHGANSITRKLTDKRAYLKTHCLYHDGSSKPLLCIIKLLPGSRYEQMVALLDEMHTDSIATYTIQDYTADELKAVDAAHKNLAMH